MIAKKHLIFIAVGACLLGLSAFASEKNPVERPLKGVGQFHAIVDVGFPFGTGDLSFVAEGVGHNTHGGVFHSHLEGFMAFGPNGLAPSSGSGTITMANGDELFMKVELDGSSTVTGGTGRFAGAIGGNSIATNVGDPVAVYDEATGTLTVDVTQSLKGTVIY